PTFEECDLALYDKPMLPFLTSRGCVRKCAMCYERILWPGYRHRSVPAIVQEMRGHLERWGIRQFSCNDLLLNGNLIFLGQLCDAVAESGLEVQWWGNAVVHRLMDRELFRKMRDGGISALVYGIESGSQKILRKMRKGYLAEDADLVLRYGNEFGIANVINLIVGFPGETAEDHQASLDFVRRNHKSIAEVGVLAMCLIYPNSPLSEQMEYYGIDPSTLDSYNPDTISLEWKDLAGLDLATRQERFWELHRLLRGYGIHVVGVEDEEELTPERISQLAEKLDCPTAWVREDAIIRLARAKDPALAPVMERALADESFLVSGQALMNLARLDPNRAWELAAPMVSRVVGYVDYAATIAVATRLDDRTMDLLEYRLSADKYSRHTADLAGALAEHRKLYAAFEEFVGSANAGRQEALVVAMRHPAGWVRRRCLRWLLEKRRERAPAQVRGLQEALAGTDRSVRRLAAEISWKAELPCSPTEIIRLLQDPDDGLRAWGTLLLPEPVPGVEESHWVVAARETLGSLSDGVWPEGEGADLEYWRLVAVGQWTRGRGREPFAFFSRALREGSAEVRLQALGGLIESGDWRFVSETMDCLEHDDAFVRRRAAEYVGRAGVLSAQSRLLPLLSDPDLLVTQEATGALARMRSPMVWRNLNRFVLETTTGELPDFMAEPIGACIDTFKRIGALEPLARRGDAAERGQAWSGLPPMERAMFLGMLERTSLESANLDLLTRALGDEQAEIRLVAAEILENLDDSAAIPSMMGLVHDPWYECRIVACRFLSKKRHEPVRPALHFLTQDPHPAVREWAGRGLAWIGNPEDLTVLRDLLEDSSYDRLTPEVRTELAPYRLLLQAEVGDAAAMRELWDGLSSSGRLHFLAMLRTPALRARFVNIVKRALRSEDAAVRLAALSVLEAIDDPATVPAVMALIQDPWHQCRAGACRFVSRHRHAAARPALYGLMHDPHDGVREWAARGLARYADPADLPVLRPLLEEPVFGGLSPEMQSDLAPMRELLADASARGWPARLDSNQLPRD
ncbi:MAG: HEAT repeat domain-containing protein, partial [Candidatus Wallbacteria bacterium]|nr:HEAT repeat domain-containing protein [Candidatus Wallbacteria bacterium]